MALATWFFPTDACAAKLSAAAEAIAFSGERGGLAVADPSDPKSVGSCSLLANCCSSSCAFLTFLACSHDASHSESIHGMLVLCNHRW